MNRVLITGPPGIGKTTAIQQVCNLLKMKNIPSIGFYTKEIRNSTHSRIGFDVVTLDGRTVILARTKDRNEMVNCKHKIGNYAVFIDEFESLVIPLLKQQQNGIIFVIDEIGKMELLSHAFTEAVMNLFKSNVKIVATIPISRMKPIPFIEKLKCSPSTTLITVNHSNRNKVPMDILSILNID